MLRINAIPNTAAGKAYYRAQNADYYLEGKEQLAHWHGRGAERLGLSGEVQQDDFEDLCENLRPGTKQQLTAKHVQNRRVGYDFTWSVPKSVSVAYALGLDERLPDVFRAAVADTMAEMEREMETRVRKGGAFENRRTGNMIWADFLHHTGRPIGGQPDPQLHIHGVVFNATFDPVEQQWKAGEFAHLKANGPYFQAVFRARLANRLQELGYEVRKTKDDFELVGVPERTLKEFSRRTAQVEKTAELLGVTRPETKAKLGATTREKKEKGLTWEDLQQLWQERLRPGELDAIRGTVAKAVKPVKVQDRTREAVDFALEHLLERSSVVRERAVVTEALKFGIGGVSPESVYTELGRRKDLIRRQVGGEVMVSTQGVLAEERRVVEFAVKGRGRFRPLSSDGRLAPRAQAEISTLSPSQQAAVRHVWASPDRLMLVRGAAGTGKTTLTRTALAGVDVPWVILAPSAEASRGVLRRDGFDQADTVAKFLLDEEMQQQVRGGLIWVDEASLLSARDAARLIQLADQLNARVVLSGDRRQHKSVTRGDVLALLEDRAGLPVAEVSDIKRQRGEYKAAVEQLAKGDVMDGFRRLDALGWVREGGHDLVVADYLAALDAKKSALIVSPTHAEGQELTGLLRQKLREAGRLKGEERQVRRLVPLNWTPAEMAKARKEGVEPAVVMERFAAYREDVQHLAVGDLLRTDASIKDMAGRRIDSGSMLTLTGFTEAGNMRVKTASGQERILPGDVGHVTPGYVVTSHAAQGRTVDRVLVAQGSQSFPASGKEQFYVSVSRGREQATIYTDSKAELQDAILREDRRMLATELVRLPRTRLTQRMKRNIAFQRRAATVSRDGHDAIRQPEREMVHER